LSNPLYDKLRLVADRRAADMITREEFLRVPKLIMMLEPDKARIAEDRARAGNTGSDRP